MLSRVASANEFLDSFAEELASVVRESDLHLLDVDRETNDGKDGAVYLLTLIVGDAHAVPESEEIGLSTGKDFVVGRVVGDAVAEFDAEIVVDVGVNVGDALLASEPEDGRIEGAPDPARSGSAKDVAAVDVVEAVNSNGLHSLPVLVNRHGAVRAFDVILPADELAVGMFLVELSGGASEGLHSVEADTALIAWNATVERVGAEAVIGDEAQLSVPFDNVLRHAVHAGKEVIPEGRRETTSFELDRALLFHKSSVFRVAGRR